MPDDATLMQAEAEKELAFFMCMRPAAAEYVNWDPFLQKRQLLSDLRQLRSCLSREACQAIFAKIRNRGRKLCLVGNKNLQCTQYGKLKTSH